MSRNGLRNTVCKDLFFKLLLIFKISEGEAGAIAEIIFVDKRKKQCHQFYYQYGQPPD